MDGAYRIKGWGQEGYYYEVSQNGRTKKALPWVAISTKHDGKSFRRIMGMKNGDSIYAAWVLMVQVAAKCPVRGVLADDDGPLSAEDLAFKTGLKAETFETAFKVLSDKTIGWLVPPARNGLQQVVDNSQQIVELRNVTRRNETLRDEDVTERDATEDSPNGESCRAGPDVSADVRKVFEHYRTYHPKAHPRPNGGMRQWKLIRARLKDDGYSAQDLCEAIDGCHKSPYHCGENESGTLYQSLDLIVRDADKVNRFIELARAPPGPVLSEATRRTLRAQQSFLARHMGKGDEQAGDAGVLDDDRGDGAGVREGGG